MTTAPAATTVDPEYPAEPIAARPRTVHRHLPRAAALRPHQREAVSAVWRQVRDGGRALVESCCGSGKTVMAAGCARRLAPRGRVLVLVPTIDLLQQTATSWSTLGGRRGQAVAACSAREALDVAATHGRIRRAVTTDAKLLAQIVKAAPDGPLTVYATYASLERIVEAHGLWGLPAWDLIVVDEAHRTAGAAGKDWAAVHDDDKVPAARRVNFTATVKVSESVDDERDGTVYSMDDEAVFGPVVYRLTVDEGINLGLITDYQVLVPVVTDKDLRDLLTLPAINDLRSRRVNAELQELALCIALLRAAKQHGLRRIITFHSRNDNARSFSKALNAAFDLLPEDERPSALWSRALAGTDSPRVRKKAFDEFAGHSDPDSDELAVLCNCRLFGEGVDVPTVDAVVYVDPKSSTVDIIQGLGRAQRLHPAACPRPPG
ncbi:DEAD/DEAH box helicase family protein [Streptacidiphilus monticola]